MVILKERLVSGCFVAGVIGLGYVGLPLAMRLAEKGVEVIGIDINKEHLSSLREGDCQRPGVDNEFLKEYQRQGTIRFKHTEDPDLYEGIDVLCITVPTPLDDAFNPDLTSLRAVGENIGRHCRGKLVILESSSYPGTTEEVLLPQIKGESGEVGKDFFLGYSPERIDPGNRDYNLADIPRVVSGITKSCLSLTQAFYEFIGVETMPVSNTQTAEMVKILENSFRALNISFINEMAQFCHHLHIDIWEVIKAAKTKPFGYMPFYPGPGAGGHCIPVDPLYLLWKARQVRWPLQLLNIAWEINTKQPLYILQRLQEELAKRGETLWGSRILLLGVTYKADVADTRESPAIILMDLLGKQGARVDYCDPYIKRLSCPFGILDSLELSPPTLGSFNAVILHTAHGVVDYDMVVRHSSLILDCRNVLGPYGGSIVLL